MRSSSRLGVAMFAVLLGILGMGAGAGAGVAGAASSPGPEPTAAEARARAHEILGAERFTDGASSPGPLDRVGTKISEWLRDILPSTDRTFSPGQGVGGFLEAIVWIVLIGLLGFVIVLLVRAYRRRSRVPEEDDPTHRSATAPEGDDLDGWAGERDPEVLEREAAAAEARGAYGLAIRLRFRAGLLRLDASGVIAFRPSLTSGQVLRAVPKATTLGGIARTFDAVAYGDADVDAQDASASREAWARVLTEVGS